MIKYHLKDYGNAIVNSFRDNLWQRGSEENTIDTYCIAVRLFCVFYKIKDVSEISRSCVRDFVEYLKTVEYDNGKKYFISTINTKIAGLNQFLELNELHKFKVKSLKKQKRSFFNDNEMLTFDEFIKLIDAIDEKDKQLLYETKLMSQTGIRISEVCKIQFEALNDNFIDIYNKGCSRQVPLPNDLKIELFNYCRGKNITSGLIFLNSKGLAVNRTSIARKMKKIAKDIGIDVRKVHPHNLRHFFALNFIKTYGYEQVSVLSDILGHSSIETTRIYLKEMLSSMCEKMTFDNLYKKIAS